MPRADDNAALSQAVDDLQSAGQFRGQRDHAHPVGGSPVLDGCQRGPAQEIRVVGALFGRVEKGAFNMPAQRLRPFESRRRALRPRLPGAAGDCGGRRNDRREKGRHPELGQLGGHIPEGLGVGGEIVPKAAVDLQVYETRSEQQAAPIQRRDSLEGRGIALNGLDDPALKGERGWGRDTIGQRQPGVADASDHHDGIVLQMA